MPEASLATPSMVIGWLMMLPAAGLLMSSAGAWVSTKTPPDLSEAVVTMPLALRELHRQRFVAVACGYGVIEQFGRLASDWNDTPAKAPPSAMRYSIALTHDISSPPSGWVRPVPGAES